MAGTFQSIFRGEQIDARLALIPSLQEALATLEAIVPLKYNKPSTGIPASDMDAAVQEALDKALTAVQSLADYYTKAQVDAIAAAIASSVSASVGEVVATLPAASESTLGKMYYVGPADGEYSRYVTGFDGTNYSWIGLGTTALDLSQYAKDDQAEDIPLSSVKTWPFILGSAGKFGTSQTYSYALIPCVPGDRFKLYGNPSYSGRYAWFTSYIKAASGDTAPLVENTERYEVPVGESVIVTAPATAAFLYIQATGNCISKVEKITTVSQDLDAVEDNGEVFTPIDIASLDLKGGYISSGGVWLNTVRYRHVIIPCGSGETYIIKGTYNSYYAFLETYSTPVNNQPAPLVDGTTRSEALNGTSARIVTPPGTKYIYLYSGDVSISYAAGKWNLPQVFGRVQDVAALAAKQEALEQQIASGVSSSDILALNPESEFVPKMLSATKRYYTSTDSNRPHPLVFLQVTDIHGNWTGVERFLEFANKYHEYIDELVNTGDTVAGVYADGVAGYDAIEGVEKILTIIGNHETREGDNWQAHVGQDAYNMMIAPFVSDWSVVQPAHAAADGLCYYYKDYAAKNVRAVFVDIMGYDSAQDEWLGEVLNGARNVGYHVVIFTHYAGARSEAEASLAAFNKVPCNYTTLYSVGGTSDNLTAYNPQAYKMMETVDSFMQAGLHFVGYVTGHYHVDFVAKCAKYPDQLIYAVGATKSGEMRDFDHVLGTRNQDEFQVIAIDPVSSIVKLYKVGAYYDRNGRSKGSVCVNYSTGEVLGEGQ